MSIETEKKQVEKSTKIVSVVCRNTFFENESVRIKMRTLKKLFSDTDTMTKVKKKILFILLEPFYGNGNNTARRAARK